MYDALAVAKEIQDVGPHVGRWFVADGALIKALKLESHGADWCLC